MVLIKRVALKRKMMIRRPKSYKSLKIMSSEQRKLKKLITEIQFRNPKKLTILAKVTYGSLRTT